MKPAIDSSTTTETVSVNFIQGILDAMSVNAIILNGEGKVELVNRAWINFGKHNGVDPSESWLGKDFNEVASLSTVCTSEEAGVIAGGISEVLSGKESTFEYDFSCEGQDQDKDRWFRMHISRFEEGNKRWIIIIHRDIADQKDTERAHEKSVTDFQVTFDHAAVGIAHVSPEGKFLRINKSFCETIGYSAVEMIGNTFQAITHPDDLQEDLDLVQQLLDGIITTYTLEKRYIHKKGHIIWASLTVALIRTDGREPEYFISVIQDITERKQAERALKESEESYKLLIEQANDGIVIIQAGVITHANVAMTKLSGFDAGEMIGHSFEGFIAEDHLQTVKENYTKRINNKPVPSTYESAIMHKEGHRIDVEFNAGLSIVNGKPADIVIIRDIGLRKREQKKVEESESRFRALYDNASFALGMAKGNKAVHELVNQAWVDLFGYSDVSEVLGIPIMDFAAPEDRALVAKYAQLRNEGKFAPPVYEIRGLRKDGTIFDMEMRVSTYTYEGELHTIAMITDITDRKLTQKDRDRIFNLSSDLITILGFDGFFKQLNPAWETVMGYEIHELIECPFLSFIHPDDKEKTSEEVKKLSEGIPTLKFENRYLTKDGSVRHLSWKATPLPEAELIYAIARDSTESKESEEQIFKYQQRLKDLGTELTLSEEKQRRQIAADLHDHVGQLMASSRLQLAALHEDMNTAEILSKTQAISKGLLRAIQATRHAIFDLSPPQLNEIGLFAATADWLEEQMEIQHGFRTRISGDDRLFPMNDKIRLLLFRCIRELLMNVVKHSGASKVHVELKEEEKQLKITVQDNGKGFNYSPEMLRLKSTGFGLFSIQERLEDLGGNMEINTTPGEGTEVTMLLPLNE